MLEVHVKDALPKSFLDILQQNVWEFPVKFVETGESLVPGDLFVDELGVGLVTPSGQKPLYVSWKASFHKWSKEKKLTQNPLIKALGAKRGEAVIDATMGLGKDSALMLACGLKVYGFERNPKIYFLAKAAQLLEEFLPDNLFLKFGEVRENEEKLPIYFDPMFDDGTKRKALPTKGMALFHKIVGGDKDAAHVGERLRALTPRLVIKRSPRDPLLLENRNSAWESKAVRFDLYL